MTNAAADTIMNICMAVTASAATLLVVGFVVFMITVFYKTLKG